MTSTQLVLLLACLVGAALSIAWVSIYNAALRYRQIISEVASNVTVLLKKRQDLIAKLTGIVESYGLHEGNIATQVAMSFGGESGGSPAPRVVERLASLRMAFPELKADGLYDTLMQQLAQVETDIASRREQFNGIVRAYNTSITQFPHNFLLRPFRFQVEAYITETDLSVERMALQSPSSTLRTS